MAATATCASMYLDFVTHVLQFQWNHFDDVLNIWLPCMEMEQQVVLREAYIDSINLLIAAMGLSSVRWSRKLLSVLSEYCEKDNTEYKALQVSYIRSKLLQFWQNESCAK